MTARADSPVARTSEAEWFPVPPGVVTTGGGRPKVEHDLGEVLRVHPDRHRGGAGLELRYLDLGDPLLAGGRIRLFAVKRDLQGENARPLHQTVAALHGGPGQLEVGDDATTEQSVLKKLLVDAAGEFVQSPIGRR